MEPVSNTPAQNTQTPPAGNIQMPPQPAPMGSPKMSGPKSKVGKILASIIILILLGISAASGYTIYKNLSSKTAEPTACTLEAKICPDGSSVGRTGPNCEFAPCPNNSFEEQNIMYSVSFVNSKAEKKKIIVYKISDESIPITETYITDADLSRKSAIKIEIEDLGYQARENLSCQCDKYLKIVPSSGEMTEFIAIESFIADSAFIYIVNDSGQVVVDGMSLQKEALYFVDGECQCSMRFGSWKDKNIITVVVSTALGNTYELTVDARTGKKVGEIVKQI